MSEYKWEDDNDYIENIDKMSNEQLIEMLDDIGCDGYYGHLHSATLVEVAKRLKERTEE